MASQSDPSVEQIEQARRRINELANEIAQLSEDSTLSPPDYYGAFLERLLQAIAAPAGAVWGRTPQGNLQLHFQINIRNVGVDRTPQGRQMHDELLRQMVANGQPRIIAPHSSMGSPDGQAMGAGNPTDFVILLVPIVCDKELIGILEVWQDPNRGREAQQGFLQFMMRMAALAANYTRNHRLKQISGQQQVWVQLEAFSRQIHGSLNPNEVSYLIANEGRRLLEADRVSIAMRQPATRVVAISGADVVEKRSSLVQLMRSLFDAVIHWGERLVYSGTKDDSLPPKVLTALDEYLNESNSKMLIVQPLLDERDIKSKKKARSALMVETFESTVEPEQQLARLEVIAKHATSALYNANEWDRIPMRFLWLPLAKIQDGLGGKAKAIITLVLSLLILFFASMIFIPYELRMEAKGQLLPIRRHKIYANFPGQVVEIPKNLARNSKVTRGQELFRMSDPDLARQMLNLKAEIEVLAAKKAESPPAGGAEVQAQYNARKKEADIAHKEKVLEWEKLVEKTGRDPEPGYFLVRAPADFDGVVLDSDFHENLLHRYVKPSEPLLRIGAINIDQPTITDFEIELKIPQKHIGQILKAFDRLKNRDVELDVDLLLTSDAARTFKGKLHRSKVAIQAIANRDDMNEPEPVVLAWVRIVGEGIDKDYEIPPTLLTTGVEVHARVRCGKHSMGYALFYGVWEFIYEKIVFFF